MPLSLMLESRQYQGIYHLMDDDDNDNGTATVFMSDHDDDDDTARIA